MRFSAGSRNRKDAPNWLLRLALSAMGFTLSASVLAVTLYEKFAAGGWLTVVITSSVIALCFLIRRHYSETREQLAKADALFSTPLAATAAQEAPAIDHEQPTAIVLVGKHRRASMHALLWVQRLFPGHFKNFAFLAVDEVDAQSYEGQEQLHRLRQTIEASLRYYAESCKRHDLATEYRVAFGTDPVAEFAALTEQVMNEYPNSVCFASKLVFAKVNFLTAWLHNQTPLEIQQRLHLTGKHMVLLPMKVG